MRICFLEGDMSRRGGTERMTALLANALSGEHRVMVISLRFDGGSLFFDLDERVEHRVLNPAKGKLGVFKQITEIRRIIKEEKIDRVINVDTGMGFYGILAARRTGARVITWEHANYFNNWGSHIFPYLRRFAARRSDAMVVLTQRDKENFEENISACCPLYVIPNPVQYHTFRYDPEARIILSVGLLVPIKGYDRVVEVARQVLPSRSDWKWVICGEGPERDRLERLIAQADLRERILLPGSVKDMDEQYRRAAVYVMTSDMEGLPMVLLEAKSWGLPIVSFDIMTGPSDIVTDEVNGFLVPPYNTEIMVEKLSALMDSTNLRKSFSAHTSVDLAKFSFESVLRAWTEVLDS